MKMYLSLLRKDFLVIKNYLPFIALLIIVYPLLFLTMEPIGSGLAAFSFAYLFAMYMATQTLGYYDSKYRKAETILNAAPISRQAIVISRYIFSLLIYVAALLVYIVMSLIIPGIERLTIVDAIIALFIGNLLMGFIIPLTYRFGIEKMRYINMIVILAVAFGFPASLKALANENVNLNFFANWSAPLCGCLILIVTLAIIALSAIVSISVYKKKEF